MTVIGYMRVSTAHQKFDSQLRSLTNYGVDQIYKEFGSGRNPHRDELKKVIHCLKPGDTLVIFKLDRLARGTKHLLTMLEDFNDRQINFVSIQNNIDTSTPMGKFFFTIMGAFAEMEAELIRERVLAGLEAARDNGKTLGRPHLASEGERAITLYQENELSIAEIAKECQISVPTIYNYLNRQGIPKKQKKSKRPISMSNTNKTLLSTEEGD